MDQAPADLQKLIEGYIDDALTAQECEALKQLLADNPKAIRQLLQGLTEDLWIKDTVHRKEQQALAACSFLDWDSNVDDEQTPQLSTHRDHAIDDEAVKRIKAIADQKLKAFLEEQAQTTKKPVYKKPVRFSWRIQSMQEAVDRMLGRVFRTGAILTYSIAGLLLLLVCVQYFRSHRVIAVVDQSVHTSGDPRITCLRPGPLTLEQGFMRLRFTSDVEVLLTAPCSVDLKTPKRIFLASGSLTAVVPEQAQGFRIDTPYSSVKDMGTEFGVSMKTEGKTRVHVFKGYVKMKPAMNSQNDDWIDMHQGQGGDSDETGVVTFQDNSDMDKAFIRAIPPEGYSNGIPGKLLDLADMVAGGNGLGTGTPGSGIDPMSGSQVTTLTNKPRVGVKRYVQTGGNPFVDGVFVPYEGMMQISSASHLFSFPKTSGKWYTEIANHGMIYFSELDKKRTPLPVILNGQTYGVESRPVLSFHANLGITFDLDCIRQSLFDSRIVKFQSLCGISSHVWLRERRPVDAEFFVLVDGQLRFHETLDLVTHSCSEISIELRDTDRFLTLVCTEGTKNSGDWSSFAMPVLELESLH